MMAAKHVHRFQRLSDTALFCECGQTKEVGAPVYPIHLCSHNCFGVTHYYPARPYTWPVPYWQSPFVYGTGDITISTGDVTTGSVSVLDVSDNNVTYTS